MTTSPSRRSGVSSVTPTGFRPGPAPLVIALATLCILALLAGSVSPGAAAGRNRSPVTADRIHQPSEEYLAATCRFDVAEAADGQPFRRLAQCDTTARLNRRAFKLSVPSTWATWGTEPTVEQASPPVLVVGERRLGITLRHRTAIAGVEIQPASATARVTVRFLDRRGRLIRRISSVVSEDGGARLFAIEARRMAIKRIVVRVDDPEAFAIAQLRLQAPPAN